MTTKQRANAPVVKPSELPDGVLSKFKGKSWDDTADERSANIRKSARETQDIVMGKTRKPKKLQNDEEHIGQSLFFSVELNKLIAKYGNHLDDIYAIPNFFGNMGRATLNFGKRLKAEGRKQGVFDIHYPHARGDWHCLYLEAKIEPNKPNAAQRVFQRQMMSAGNLAIVVYGNDAQSLAATLARVVSMYEECGPYQALSSPGGLGYVRRAFLAQCWQIA